MVEFDPPCQVRMLLPMADSPPPTSSPPAGMLRYAQRQKPFSGALELILDANGLTASKGRSTLTIPFAEIEKIVLTFTPRNTSFRTFTCKVHATNRRKLRFDSLSWKSLIETDKLDPEFRQFVAALAERSAASNPKLQLHAGFSPLRHKLMLFLGVILGGGLIACTVYAAIKGAAMVGLLSFGVTGYLIWWLREVLTRNRPRDFTPDSLPDGVLPDMAA